MDCETDTEVSTCEVLLGKVEAPRINQVRAGWDRSIGRATPSLTARIRKHTHGTYSSRLSKLITKREPEDDLGCVSLLFLTAKRAFSCFDWEGLFYSDELKRKLILSFVTSYCLWAPPNNGESFYGMIFHWRQWKRNFWASKEDCLGFKFMIIICCDCSYLWWSSQQKSGK